MSTKGTLSKSRMLTTATIVGAILSLGLLTWFSYLSTREWQRNARLLAAERANEAVDLVVAGFARDMRGVQRSVLGTLQLTDFAPSFPYGINNVVANTFARYPYPESFFGWRGAASADGVVFFNRFDRRPAWSSPRGGEPRFPVTMETELKIGRRLIDRILLDAASQRPFSIFELHLGGQPHQVVARLLYEDAQHEHLAAVFGFMVNLTWARQYYFAELAQEVIRVGGTRSDLALSIVDEAGQAVVGDPEAAGGQFAQRAFPVLFFDPLIVGLDPPHDLSRASWAVESGFLQDPTLRSTIRGAQWALVIAAMAAAVMVSGLMLTARAAKASEKLADVRSDFVSGITHELKTPIATLRAVGETLVSGRFAGPLALREYAELVVQEAKRLARLVNNLLAYSRITDVTDAYSFEPLPVMTVVDDALQEFRCQLETLGFNVHVNVPQTLPTIRGDRIALSLMLDNILDNGIRYSGEGRQLFLEGTSHGRMVDIAVRDHGVGIPEDELDHVTKRFFRGRLAQSGGSGLGLAIASRIVADHGGALTICSTIDVGTTVRVSLPVTEALDEAANSSRRG